MVIAAAKGCPYPTDQAKRSPVEAYLRERGSHHASNEDEVLAVLGAEKLCGAPKLTDRDPMMTKSFGRLSVANALQREDHGMQAARLQGLGDCKRHGSASGDQADR